MLSCSVGKGKTMKVLLATPLYSQHYDSGHFWLKALNDLGHSVIVWDYRLQPAPLKREPWDLTLVLKGENLDPRLLPTPKVCYWPDDLGRTPGIESILRYYDKVFTPVRPTPDNMEWLPTGWDPDIHVDRQIERGIPSLYIGTNNSPYKKDMVDGIWPSVVAGNGWESEAVVVKIGLSRRDLPSHYLHDFVYLANVAEILIDVHQSPHVGLNRKLFEMIACGFTLVDRVPGVEELLGFGLTNQVSFRTADEAKELIQYYLTRPGERGEVWRQERERIVRYTYLEAAKRILVEVSRW